jgi:RNA recognition motif-containing protein
MFIEQKIQYAKNKSDSAAKADGTFDIRLKRKRDEENAANSMQPPSSGATKIAKIVSNSNPNRILFAQELPMNYDETVLLSLFQQCSGFTEIRMVPGNKKIAFIEFNDETQATIALRQLNGFELSPGDVLHLTYSNL